MLTYSKNIFKIDVYIKIDELWRSKMQSGKKEISQAVILRLPHYYNFLGEMLDKGEKKVSSSFISRQLGYTASQVRQDLNNFGEFGKQGYGYDVDFLRARIGEIIGFNKTYHMVLIGVGNIGKALALYSGFRREGFHITAAFDASFEGESKMDNGVRTFPIHSLADYVAENKVDIAVIAVPKAAAQAIADHITACGIKAIWNFAPVQLKVTDDVLVENTNMSESLYTLCYKLNNDTK